MGFPFLFQAVALCAVLAYHIPHRDPAFPPIYCTSPFSNKHSLPPNQRELLEFLRFAPNSLSLEVTPSLLMFYLCNNPCDCPLPIPPFPQYIFFSSSSRATHVFLFSFVIIQFSSSFVESSHLPFSESPYVNFFSHPGGCLLP